MSLDAHKLDSAIALCDASASFRAIKKELLAGLGMTIVVLGALRCMVGTSWAEDAPKPVAQTPTPVCTYPEKLPFEFTINQVSVLELWSQGQDYSHLIWQSINPSLEAQIVELKKKYCK